MTVAQLVWAEYNACAECFSQRLAQRLQAPVPAGGHPVQVALGNANAARSDDGQHASHFEQRESLGRPPVR
jgi:hypothetical protein